MPAASTCAQINQLQVLIQRGEVREIWFVRWRRPMLIMINEAAVVVVLHEPSTEAVRAVDESLGAERRSCGVVDELQHARRDDVNRLRWLEFVKPVFFHTLWLERRRRESTSR